MLRQYRGEGLGLECGRKGGTAKGGAYIAGESQGGVVNEKARNRVSDLTRMPEKVALPAELKDDVIAHGLWKRGTTAMFGIMIVNLDEGSYLCMTPEKAPSNVRK